MRRLPDIDDGQLTFRHTQSMRQLTSLADDEADFNPRAGRGPIPSRWAGADWASNGAGCRDGVGAGEGAGAGGSSGARIVSEGARKVQRGAEGSRSARGGRLEELKGQLESIRDRFRDVKIEDMRERMEAERIEEEKARAREEERARHRAQHPHEAYFTKYKNPLAPPAPSAPLAPATPPQAERRGRWGQRGAGKVEDLDAKSYFERTRAQHLRGDWHTEQEACMYFEEKRRMADAAWRMQQQLDAKPQKWQEEWKKAGSEPSLRKKAPQKAPPQKAPPQNAPSQKAPHQEKPAGYLFPWGVPKPQQPLQAPKLPTNVPWHLEEELTAGDSSEDSPHGLPLSMPNMPQGSLTFNGAQSMGTLTLSLPISTKEPTALPVSFNPSGFRGSSGGGWTTPSFEPLSPKGGFDYVPEFAANGLKSNRRGLQHSAPSLGIGKMHPSHGEGEVGDYRHLKVDKVKEAASAFPSSKLLLDTVKDLTPIPPNLAEPYSMSKVQLGMASDISVGKADDMRCSGPEADVDHGAEGKDSQGLESVDSPPSVLQATFCSSSHESDLDTVAPRDSKAFWSDHDDFQDDEDDAPLVHRLEAAQMLSKPAALNHGLCATQSRVETHSALQHQTGSSALGRGAPAAIVGEPRPAVLQQATELESPPMVLSVLGPSRGIQEFML